MVKKKTQTIRKLKQKKKSKKTGGRYHEHPYTEVGLVPTTHTHTHAAVHDQTKLHQVRNDNSTGKKINIVTKPCILSLWDNSRFEKKKGDNGIRELE